MDAAADVAYGGKMIERKHRYGNLVFDRDAIVRAALRAYVEAIVHGSQDRRLSFSFPSCDCPGWTGDLKRGAFYNGDGCGAYNVVAWTEEGIVGLAFEIGCGPIEQLDLSVEAVTGGPDDVRGALPGLPDALEPALVLATGMLEEGPEHREKLAGLGFWLCGDHLGGTFFDDPTACGAEQLAMCGLLRGGRLLSRIYRSSHPDTRATLAAVDRKEAPIHALIDAVVDRALKGPTELTPAEFEALLYPLDMPPLKRVRSSQRMLEKVGITWPGSPPIPEPPQRKGYNPFLRPPGTVYRDMPGFRSLDFNRDAIIRAAKRAYVETVLAQLDPQKRYPFTVCLVPRWKGDLAQGAFSDGNRAGDYEVIAWTEAGIVGLAYQRGFGPIEHLGLPLDAVTGGPDDVRAALPELPQALEPALALAVEMLSVGSEHGEKLASVGFWLLGTERVGGSLFDHDKTAPGAGRLSLWGGVAWGKLVGGWRDPEVRSPLTQEMRDRAEPIQELVETVAERALDGPTELTAEELATLLPTPPDPERLLTAQRRLQQVGVTWRGSPEIPELS